MFKLGYLFTICFSMLFTNCSQTPTQNDKKIWEEYSKFAYINIKNESGFTINSVMFFPYDITTKTINLKNKSDTTINLNCRGEGSYVLIAILSNGDTLKTRGNYFEGGYKLTENILKDTIITKY